MLRAGFQAIRDEQGVPAAFPDDVLAEADAVARAPQPPPAPDGRARRDATDLPFVTIDPAGSTDLDQAVHIERRGSGFRVHYAIADVATFVRPGGAIDAEAHRRGVTFYSPDLRTSLHPTVLSEGAASLLPDVVRPSVLWRIDLDSSGSPVEVDVERALVRSVAKLSYTEVQRALDDGTADDAIVALRDVGRLRQDREVERGGIDVRVPDQEIEDDGPGFRLAMRAPHPVESWNAQISLLTGMCAARMMLDAGVGIVRTMPPPAPEDYDRLRRTAAGLDIDWPADVSYARFVRTLDPRPPAHAAFLNLVTILLRSAGYTQVLHPVGDQEPDVLRHAAVASAYAHVTAPLRRLVDRYGTECCLAVAAGEEVPEWVCEALPALPEEMRVADQRARALDRACVDLMESVLLESHVGEEYQAVVVDERKEYDVVQLHWPAVRAHVRGGGLGLGRRVRLRLTAADPVRRTVEFAPA
ncbi:MAG: RNB domain-containing ribonuclease [Frankiales bacterium]|nr:RNB domain-containing ribonuclease [Frankiales bacterium]